ncbi:MAG TPA: MFS transporter [Ktedonobacterales bacterium]|nr:MFS transporter [Ktedonobacterales bacterium]
MLSLDARRGHRRAKCPDATLESQEARVTQPTGATVPAPPAPPVKRASLWRNRDYMLLWSGQTVSSIGSGVSDLAFPLLILALTHSPAQAGIAGGLRTLAYVCFSLPAGALADRWDRKRMMLVCDTGRALILATIPIAAAFGRLTFLQLCLCAFGEGTLFVFFNLAEVAALPQVVAPEAVPAAMSQNAATQAISDLVSSPLSGLLFTIGRALPFLADALSYTASVASLMLIRAKFQRQRATSERRQLRREIKEGMAFLLRHPVIGPMSILNGVNNFFSGGALLIIIVLLQQEHTSARGIGLILGISGVGGIVGALLGDPVQRRFRYGPTIAVLMWTYTLIFALMAPLHAPVEIALLLIGWSFLNPLYNVVIISYRLAATPDELQGRVNSVARLLSNALTPVGLALTGVLLQQIGTVPTILVVVVGKMFVVLAVTLHRGIRTAPRIVAAG